MVPRPWPVTSRTMHIGSQDHGRQQPRNQQLRLWQTVAMAQGHNQAHQQIQIQLTQLVLRMYPTPLTQNQMSGSWSETP